MNFIENLENAISATRVFPNAEEASNLLNWHKRRVEVSKETIDSVLELISEQKQIIDDLTYSKVTRASAQAIVDAFDKLHLHQESLIKLRRVNRRNYTNYLCSVWYTIIIALNKDEKFFNGTNDYKNQVIYNTLTALIGKSDLKDPTMKKAYVDLTRLPRFQKFTKRPLPKKQEKEMKCPEPECECSICKRLREVVNQPKDPFEVPKDRKTFYVRVLI